jgi:hypothetical protein
VPSVFHPSYCTPTKSNLYFEISFATALSEPALNIFLTFHVRNLISIFFRLGRLSKEFVQVRGPMRHFVTSPFFSGEGFLAPHPTPSCSTTSCRLSATAYSIYLQLPSIPGGRLLHPQPEDAPCHSDKGLTYHVRNAAPYIYAYM